MAQTRPNGGSSNTAIVAIVVLVLIAVVAFVFFFWNGEETTVPPEEGPDIELQVEPPATNGDGGEGGDQSGGAPGESP